MSAKFHDLRLALQSIIARANDAQNTTDLEEIEVALGDIESDLDSAGKAYAVLYDERCAVLHNLRKEQP